MLIFQVMSRFIRVFAKILIYFIVSLTQAKIKASNLMDAL